MRRSHKMFALMLAVLALFAAVAEAASRTFVLHRVSAVDVLPKVRALLTENGRAELDPANNAIVVHDTADALSAVASLVKSLDADGPRVGLTVRRLEASMLEGLGAPIAWRTMNGVWRSGSAPAAIGAVTRYDAPGKRLVVHSSSDAAAQEYVVAPGETAQVVLGGRVRADRVAAGVMLGQLLVRDVQSAEAQALVLVTPTLSPDAVFLQVVPAVIVYEDGGARINRFSELSVSAKGPRSGQIFLGTNDAPAPGPLSAILGGLDTNASGRLHLAVDIRVLESGDAR
ncbi:MAG: hypothetical protein M5R36_18755 [Deltaproteobacteria bacterium]|nr:hypothetical protein [Deltaproteobacteria bacterium]